MFILLWNNMRTTAHNTPPHTHSYKERFILDAKTYEHTLKWWTNSRNNIHLTATVCRRTWTEAYAKACGRESVPMIEFQKYRQQTVAQKMQTREMNDILDENLAYRNHHKGFITSRIFAAKKIYRNYLRAYTMCFVSWAKVFGYLCMVQGAHRKSSISVKHCVVWRHAVPAHAREKSFEIRKQENNKEFGLVYCFAHTSRKRER